MARTWRSVAPVQMTKYSAIEVCSRTSITTGSQAFFSVAALRSKRASCNGVSRLVRSAANLPIIHIEAVLGDVPLDGRRQPIAHRLPLRDRPAEGAAGDVRGGARAQDHPRRIEAGGLQRGRIRGSAAWPADDHDRRQSADLIGY